VQTNVRKLLAMQLSDWQQPLDSPESLNRRYRPDMPQLDAALNGLRARAIQPDGISLGTIKQVSAPQEPLLDADPPDEGKFVPEILRQKKTGNKLLYQCNATAKLRLPPDRLAGLPATTLKVLGIDGQQISADVQYRTELTPESGLWVAVGFSHPLVEISLRSLLSQQTASASDK
jgi:hypothetical protein